MTTLILPPRHTGDAQRMWRAATARGWHVKRAMGWRVEPVNGDVCVYGEALFVRAVCQQLGIEADEPPLDWLDTLEPVYLSREVRCGPLSTLLELPFPRFVKPADQKSFPARVWESADSLAAQAGARPDCPSIASDPVHFSAEYRCFVIGHEVLTLSVYSRDGELAGSDESGYPSTEEELDAAREFATTVLVDNSPCWAAVVDVGVLDDGRWAVVEANPCWGSGLYGCDSHAALDVIAAAF